MSGSGDIMLRGHFLRPSADGQKKRSYDARDVMELTRPFTVLVFASCLISHTHLPAPIFLSPRKISANARRRAIGQLAAVAVHCHALYMPLNVHADTVLVSAQGDVFVTLTASPSDSRYSSPEAHFGMASCVVWSIACLLVKLVTGAPLVRSRCDAAHTALRVVGTLHGVDELARFDGLFDAFDASVKWRNRVHVFRMPRGATLAERTLLKHALTWSRRVRICRGGVFLANKLEPVVE